ncbi:hypothetical protein P8452_26341 [Trifolium repens]|nr:hypothetical protein P8452_26341 [Trifolium repens]
MTEKTIEASRQGLSLSELSIAELDDSDGVLIIKNELRMRVHTFIIYIARIHTSVKFKLTLREKCFICKILLVGSSVSMVEFVYKCKALQHDCLYTTSKDNVMELYSLHSERNMNHRIPRHDFTFPYATINPRGQR